MKDTIMATYSRLPVTFVKGEGERLWDSEGKEYLDGIAGIAVCSLGHAHPAVTEAIADQAATLVHTSNLYGIEAQQQLAQKLTELSGMENVFFSNSGTEANEAALKLARRYGYDKGIDKPHVIVVEGSFHGRTMAALSATGNSKIQQGFAPLLEGFIRVPYNNLAAIEAHTGNADVVAVMVEPVQGEGGVNVPEPGYLQAIRQLCDQHDWLMMLDEIQTGMCRTGKWFGFQHEQLLPDVMTLAKALGNGFPIGACLASGKAAGVLAAGMHGSTFGGSPLACRTALAVIETMEKQSLAEQAAESGRYLVERLSPLSELDGVIEVRGKGMMIGIELENDCGELVGKALEQGLLINVTVGNVVRLLPPLVMTQASMEQLAEGVSSLIKTFVTNR